MSITTYSALLSRLFLLIDGEGVTVTPISTLAAAISMGEQRIYREVRSRFNEVAFSSVTVSNNLAALPSDFESPSTVHFGGKPLDPVSEDWLREYLQSNPTGECRYFAVAGPNLMFGPTVANDTAVQGRYFASLDPLDATTLPTNALFARAEDLFVYAALAESAPFFEQDARIPLWEAKYRSIRDALNNHSHTAAYSVGRMKRRPSTPILR